MKAAADKVLKDAVGKGDVPGVVATATDAKGMIYEGAFGKRMLGQARDVARHRGLDRLDDQGDHRRRRDAAGRAGQARAGCAGQALIPALDEVRVLTAGMPTASR